MSTIHSAIARSLDQGEVNSIRRHERIQTASPDILIDENAVARCESLSIELSRGSHLPSSILYTVYVMSVNSLQAGVDLGDNCGDVSILRASSDTKEGSTISTSPSRPVPASLRHDRRDLHVVLDGLRLLEDVDVQPGRHVPSDVA